MRPPHDDRNRDGYVRTRLDVLRPAKNRLRCRHGENKAERRMSSSKEKNTRFRTIWTKRDVYIRNVRLVTIMH